jgi:hypothetical protein
MDRALTWKQRLLIAGVALLLGLFGVSRIHLIPNALSIEVMPPEQEDLYKVYYDLGAGFNETDSITTMVQPGERRQMIHFSGFPARNIKTFRIDPGMREGAVWIASITLQYEFRYLKIHIPLYRWTGERLLADFTPLHHIRDFALTEQGLALTSTGDDAHFAYRGQWQTILDSAAIAASRVSRFLYVLCMLCAAVIYGLLAFHRVVRRLVSFVRSHERFLINLSVTFAMLLLYLLIASHVLPEGINSTFASLLWKFVLISMTVGFYGLFFFGTVLKERPSSIRKTIERFQAQDLLLLFLPLTPIVQYLILNQNVLKITDSIIIMIFFTALTFISSLIVPWLLSIAGSRILLISAGLSLTFVLLNMSALAANFHWHLVGNPLIQLGIFIVTAAILFFLYTLNRKRTYWAVALFFLVNTAMTMVKVTNDQPEIRDTSVTIPNIYASVEGRQMVSTPDIFLLVYESYANQETMLHYGFDNRAQIDFLKEMGFTIYPGTYSTGSMSLESLGRLLHVTNHIQQDRMTSYTSGANAVGDILKSFGYKTFGIFPVDYFLQNSRPAYDDWYPPINKMYPIFITAILEGEFRYNIGFDAIPYNDYLLKKREAFTQRTQEPAFLYTHSMLPGHSQESGKCLPDEKSKYLKGIKDANQEMGKDLALLMKSRPNAIVIVAGDHGPYLTKGCFHLENYAIGEIDRLDIQDRYGTFLAIKWPERAYAGRYDIRILQDIFPAVFAYLFKDDTIFDAARIEREDLYGSPLHGIRIENGIIKGGKDDGKPLFLGIQ